MTDDRPLCGLFSLATKDEAYIELALHILERGGFIYATKGTLSALRSRKRYRKLSGRGRDRLRSVSFYTDFAESADGRLKTLHPHIHAAIQSRRPRLRFKNRRRAAIDLVCVDLKPGDVGGLALIKSAIEGGKMLATQPQDAVTIRAELDRLLRLMPEEREVDSTVERLHAEGYVQMAARLAKDAKRCASPPLILAGRKEGDLRYGENPSQTPASCYRLAEDGEPSVLDRFEQVLGRESSVSNKADRFRTARMLEYIAAVYERNFGPHPRRLIALISKHGIPCGAAVREAQSDEDLPRMKREVLTLAAEGDAQAARGGCVAVNFALDETDAEVLRTVDWRKEDGRNGRPYDIVLAPAFVGSETPARFQRPHGRAQLYANPLMNQVGLTSFLGSSSRMELIHLDGEILTQPSFDFVPKLSPDCETVLARGEYPLSERELRSAALAWGLVAFMDTNAIALVLDERMVSGAAKVASRVKAAQFACRRLMGPYQGELIPKRGLVAASDGFLLPDAASTLFGHVSIIVTPYGSERDPAVANLTYQREDRLLLWFDSRIGRAFSGHK